MGLVLVLDAVIRGSCLFSGKLLLHYHNRLDSEIRAFSLSNSADLCFFPLELSIMSSITLLVCNKCVLFPMCKLVLVLCSLVLL